MNTAPTTYVIRVRGHLDDHWSAWFGELDLTRDDDGGSTVTVSVADQAQLLGLLACLRDIGAVLTELRTTGAPAPICRSVLEHPLHHRSGRWLDTVGYAVLEAEWSPT